MHSLFIKIFSVLIIVFIMLFTVLMAVMNYRADYFCHIIVPFFGTFETRVAAIILLTFVLGGTTGAIYVLKVNAECDQAIDYYREKIKRISVNADSDSSLIDSLQRKIASLEIALENALRDKNS